MKKKNRTRGPASRASDSRKRPPVES
ncbi:MAG: hypothetical protein QOH32_4886, partial [Bradyrhizobium sp.]|nr:hypothetical protein [Bradyrhizobium sp.]